MELDSFAFRERNIFASSLEIEPTSASFVICILVGVGMFAVHKVGKLFDFSPTIGRILRDIHEKMAVNKLEWQQIEGYDFKIRGGNWVAAGVNGSGSRSHEHDELQIVDWLLRDADYLVDVGANSGLYCCLAARRGIGSFAFEPFPTNQAILLSCIEKNGFGKLVEVFPIAISDSVGCAQFYGRGQGASLVKGWGGHVGFDCVKVPTNTLDNVLFHRITGKNAVIKIDVEGAELEVLRGAAKILVERPSLLIEISLTRNQPGGFNNKFEEVFQMLFNCGYRAFIANADRTPVSSADVREWVVARKINIGTENFLFVPVERA